MHACLCGLQLGVGDEPKRYYSTLPGPLRAREREAASGGRRKEEGGSQPGVRHSLYQSPHLLLLQGYNQQVRRGEGSVRCVRDARGVGSFDVTRALCVRTAWCTC